MALIYQSCTKDKFPVPPASTVPLFTYTIDNEELAPATVSFTNISIIPEVVGDASFLWNFGDGTSSSELNPSHLYEQSGAYTVNLVVLTSISLEINEFAKVVVIKDPNASGTPIYYTDGSQIYEGLINSQDPIFTTLNGASAQSSYGMIMDTANLHLYMSDYGADKIYRSNLDGSNFIEFRTGVDSPIGLSIDYQENQIYWNTGSGIQRANLDDTDVSQKEDFVTGQSNDPDGLSIDLINRKIYWVNYDGGLWVKNLDGSGETELIPDIEGGSILVIGDRIYFDQWIGSGDVHLKSANLDGSDVSTIATNMTKVVYALAYDSDEQKIYWGDRGTDAIMRANLDGSNLETWYLNEGVDPRGITIGIKK